MTEASPSGPSGHVQLGAIELAEYPTPDGAPMSVVRLAIAAGAVHDWTGARRSWRLYQIVSGELIFHLGGQDVAAIAGHVVFIPPGTRYRYENHSADLTDVFLCTSPAFDPADELPATKS